jgi:hypothetical protein
MANEIIEHGHTRVSGPMTALQIAREIEAHKKACAGLASLSYSTHDTRRYNCTVCIGFKCFGRIEERDRTEEMAAILRTIKDRDYDWVSWFITDVQVAIIADAMEAWHVRQQMRLGYCKTAHKTAGAHPQGKRCRDWAEAKCTCPDTQCIYHVAVEGDF